MKIAMLSAVGLLLAAGSANATTFSFASDVDHTSFTFAGFGQVLRDAQDRTDPVSLLIDDDNGPLPALSFDLEFQFDALLTHVASIPVGGGQFLHTYSLGGSQGPAASFGFYDALGAPVLTAQFVGGIFSADGTAATWGSTAGVQAGDITGQVVYTWHGADMPAYGLFTGQSVGLDDAAFTLSFLQSASGPGVSLGSTAPYPVEQWASEGSFSGTAHFVPAPGLVSLAGMSLGFMGRRRR